MSLGIYGSDGKASVYDVGDPGSIPGLGRSLGEGNGNPLPYYSWKIPRTEEPGRLQSMGLQRVGHDWANELNWIEGVFSVKGVKKNTEKSYAWSGFSKIGLWLVRLMDFVRNDTAIRKLVRVNQVQDGRADFH